MKTRIIILTFISLSFTMCNMTFLNHKDYRFRVKDFVWNIKNESNNSNVLKEIGQGAGTNTSGFSALLAGYREPHGNFTVLNDYTGFWTSTEPL